MGKIEKRRSAIQRRMRYLKQERKKAIESKDLDKSTSGPTQRAQKRKDPVNHNQKEDAISYLNMEMISKKKRKSKRLGSSVKTPPLLKGEKIRFGDRVDCPPFLDSQRKPWLNNA